jgi:hypothetical protein
MRDRVIDLIYWFANEVLFDSFFWFGNVIAVPVGIGISAEFTNIVCIIPFIGGYILGWAIFIVVLIILERTAHFISKFMRW